MKEFIDEKNFSMFTEKGKISSENTPIRLP